MAAPPVVEVDLAHGGRWTSLRAAGREWLWTNPDPDVQAARPHAAPGDGFVDAGGVEECFPTLRGVPDHGDVWSRPWTGTAEDASVVTHGLRLRRTVRTVADALVLGYEVTGEPGTPFVHAVHALLDVGPQARLEVPGATSAVVLDSDDPDDADRRWPSGLDRLGPDDGTALCAVLPGVHEATVVDGGHRLHLRWDATGQPELCSLVLWRNLRGWPDSGPYRSIGVEALLGRTVDAGTPDGGAARLDRTGRAAWSLTLHAGPAGPAR